MVEYEVFLIKKSKDFGYIFRGVIITERGAPNGI